MKKATVKPETVTKVDMDELFEKMRKEMEAEKYSFDQINNHVNKFFDSLKDISRYDRKKYVSHFASRLMNYHGYSEKPYDPDEKFSLDSYLIDDSVKATIYPLLTNDLKPELVSLYDYLIKKKYTVKKKFGDLRCDTYMYHIPVELPKKKYGDIERIRAMVLETQSNQFLIVLQDIFGCVEVHIREWWNRIDETENDYDIERFESGIKGKTGIDLFNAALASLSSCNKYSDWQSKTSVDFPSIECFGQNFYCFGHDKSLSGSRYGDGRDAGYILSLTHTSITDPLVYVWPKLQYVMYNLSQAFYFKKHPKELE